MELKTMYVIFILLTFITGIILLSVGGAFYSYQKKYSKSTPITEKKVVTDYVSPYIGVKYVVDGKEYNKNFDIGGADKHTFLPYKDASVIWYNPANPTDATIVDPWLDINGRPKASGKSLLIAGGVIMGLLVAAVILERLPFMQKYLA